MQLKQANQKGKMCRHLEDVLEHIIRIAQFVEEKKTCGIDARRMIPVPVCTNVMYTKRAQRLRNPPSRMFVLVEGQVGKRASWVEFVAVHLW